MKLSEPQLDQVFHALSDTTRRAILLQVRSAEKSVNDIASQFEISLPAVSKHLSILETAGLLKRRKQGRQRLCSVDPAQIKNASEWLDFYQHFWNESLDSLKHYIEKESAN